MSQAIDSDAGRPVLEVRSPRTGELDATFDAHTPAEARDMVARAREVQVAWGARPVKERVRIVRAIRDRMIERVEDIAATVGHRIGKARFEALAEAALGTDAATYYADLAESLRTGRPAKAFPPLLRSARVHYRPLGVALVLSPWNYPWFLSVLHVMPALAAGNAVIQKPSEHCPDVGLLLGEICSEAGLPEDVLQIAVGGPEVGGALIDARVDIISITGSPRTGRAILRAAAEHLTPVILELGGNDAAIVCADAPWERAATAITFGAFMNAGQTCIGMKRALIAAPLYDRVVERIGEHATSMMPQKSDNEPVGPLVLAAEADRLERQIAKSVEMGARLVCGGKRLEGAGNWFPPTVLADCTPDMPGMQEESFGPLLCLMKVESDEHALEIANGTDYGLSGAIWTRDRRRAERIARRFHTGSIAINDVFSPAMNVATPFGGVKSSGFGRAGGEQGYLAYCNVQSIVRTTVTPESEPFWAPYTDLNDALAHRWAGWRHSSITERFKRLFGKR